ncbi:MAG: hypothetical protein IKU78_03940 [Paludibacteraceae bacterium]|nr:hypothetical protein [Paludibacteraceae bacterium]
MGKKNSDENKVQYLPICMCLGLSVGMLIGNVVFDNISLGMCFGMGIGVFIGATLDAKNKNNKNDEDAQKGDKGEENS